MNPNLTSLNQNVQNTGQDVAKLTESIPGLLSGLKTNLTSIFTKDNPMFQQRESALNTYLNTPSSTRAELLPGNQPMVEGSPLNFSPTQQNAIVTARSNAAMVPLAGLNQSIVGQGGNLADMLSSAGGIYGAQLQGLQQKSTLAQQLYQNAVEEAKRAEQIRQFNAQEARLGAGSGMGDLSSLISALFGQQNQQPDISTFDTPDQSPSPTGVASQPIEIPGQGTIQPYTPPQVSNQLIPDRWNPLAQLGSLGELLFGGPRNQSAQQPTTSLNLLGMGGNKFGF